MSASRERKKRRVAKADYFWRLELWKSWEPPKWRIFAHRKWRKNKPKRTW